MYHITSRGNRRSALFYDHQDHQAYLDILDETKFYYPFYLHAYCLMTNHVHLQIETINHHTKHIMKRLNSRYAMYFNKRHRLVGHVFQGRYGAEIIETKDYLLEVSRYIHLKQGWLIFRKNIVGAATRHTFQTKIIHTCEPIKYYPIFPSR